MTERQQEAYARGRARMAEAIERRREQGGLTYGWITTHRAVEVSGQWHAESASAVYERLGAVVAIDTALATVGAEEEASEGTTARRWLHVTSEGSALLTAEELAARGLTVGTRTLDCGDPPGGGAAENSPPTFHLADADGYAREVCPRCWDAWGREDAARHAEELERRRKEATMNPLQSYGLTVTQGMTQPTRPRKAPRRVWEVGGATAGFEDLFYRLGGKKWRGKFSFWEDPTEALLEALPTEERQSFGERLEAKQERAEERAERYQERAEAAEGRSVALWEQGDRMASIIPFGQPILVGHHSEKRDRNYRARIVGKFEKAHEEGAKAEHYRGKAAGAARTAAPKDLGFMGRRLKEAEAELRDVERKLPQAKEGGEWHARLLILQAEYREKVAHWKAEMEAAGGVAFSRENVAKGDVVFRLKDRHLYEVLRVNAQSVTSTYPYGGNRFQIPYAEIREVVPASKAVELEAKATAKGLGEEVGA